MSKPLPSDFPDIDLAAWNASMPFPGTPADAALWAATRVFHVPQDVIDAPAPSGVARLIQSPVEARGVRRRKEKP